MPLPVKFVFQIKAFPGSIDVELLVWNRTQRLPVLINGLTDEVFSRNGIVRGCLFLKNLCGRGCEFNAELAALTSSSFGDGGRNSPHAARR